VIPSPLLAVRSTVAQPLAYMKLIMLGSVTTQTIFNRPLKNVFEVADARQKQAKKRSLCLINEHFESVFNTAAATQIVFQRPVSTFNHLFDQKTHGYFNVSGRCDH